MTAPTCANWSTRELPKGESCPEWCTEDHSESTSWGYHCSSGKTVIELPFTAEVADRNRTGGCSASAIAVRLNAWTVEDDDVECWGVSSRESIQLRLGELGGDQLDVTMSEYETRQLIALLTVHANMEARR